MILTTFLGPRMMLRLINFMKIWGSYIQADIQTRGFYRLDKGKVYYG